MYLLIDQDTWTIYTSPSAFQSYPSGTNDAHNIQTWPSDIRAITEKKVQCLSYV